MSANAGVELDLDFAFHHAINLAEASITVQDKRIGGSTYHTGRITRIKMGTLQVTCFAQKRCRQIMNCS